MTTAKPDTDITIAGRTMCTTLEGLIPHMQTLTNELKATVARLQELLGDEPSHKETDPDVS